MRIPTALLYILFAATPVGLRKLVYGFTPGFDEYEVVFLYASDFVIVLFLLSCGAGLWAELRSRGFFWAERGINLALFGFLALATASILSAAHKLLSLYALIRLFSVAFLALAVAGIFSSSEALRRRTFWLLSLLGAAEALIGFGQFLFQHSFGLWFLGEPFLPALLSPDFAASAARFAPGIAKVDMWGAKLIRAYGTFPHPNILSAFLLMGLFSACALWLSVPQPNYRARPRFTDWTVAARQRLKTEIPLGIIIFVIALGLLVTFSRAGWLLAAFFGPLMALQFMGYSETRRAAFKLAGLLAWVVVLFYVGFGSLIFPRASITASEPSVSYRLAYNELALEIVARAPLGVGIGNQLIYSVNEGLYKSLGMPERWQWQPVHNIYLLSAAETGLAGGAFFAGFMILLSQGAVRKLLRRSTDITGRIYLSAAYSIFFSFLLFGFADHFFWTLQPGRLMFWLSIGLMLGALKAVEKRAGS